MNTQLETCREAFERYCKNVFRNDKEFLTSDEFKIQRQELWRAWLASVFWIQDIIMTKIPKMSDEDGIIALNNFFADANAEVIKIVKKKTNKN